MATKETKNFRLSGTTLIAKAPGVTPKKRKVSSKDASYLKSISPASFDAAAVWDFGVGVYSARKRRTNPKTRRTKRNATMAGKKLNLKKIALIGGGVALAYYLYKKMSGGALANPLPIVALRDPSRPVGSTGQSYGDREQNRANAVEAAKYLKPGISDAKAKEIADAMMRSGLMRSFAQRTLSVSEWTNLQAFRNVVANLAK